MDNISLFSGYSFDKIGPYLVLDDLEYKKRSKFYFSEFTCSIQKLQKRFCVGRYDLLSFKTYQCPNIQLLDITYKGNHCPKCDAYTGFNPAFYNFNRISPQQRKYNELPHVVYLAYFAPGKIKVGIAAKGRMAIRLLEQGARAAVILREYSDAYQARNLEKQLHETKDISDNFKSSDKLKFMSEYIYKFEDALSNLKDTIALIGITPIRDIMDLNEYYFYKKNYSIKHINIPIGKNADIVCGKCLGLIGDAMIVEQKNKYFAISIKKYVSYLVSISTRELNFEYQIPERQMSLFDFGC